MHHEEKHTKETEKEENKSSLVAKYQSVETSRLDLESINISLLSITSVVNNSKKKEALS